MAYKKTPLLASVLLSSALVLAACGENEEVTQPIGEQTPSEQPVSTDDASPGGGIGENDIGGEIYGFTEFDLDVDYPDQDNAFDVSYEEDRDQVTAAYQNTLTETDLTGDEAMNEIELAFGQLELDQETPDEEVISQVIDAFGIEEGYSSIELEIRYSDGTDREYQESQN